MSWTIDEVATLLKRLGEENARKLLDCRKVRVVFDTGGKLATISASVPPFTVWKINAHCPDLKTGADLYRALKDDGFAVDAETKELFFHEGDFRVNRSRDEVDYVHLSRIDLGLPSGSPISEVLRLGCDLGLEGCLVDDAANLRMNYKDQPADERLVMMMRPIRNSKGQWRTFVLENTWGSLRLTSTIGFGDFPSSDNERYVFRFPRE